MLKLFYLKVLNLISSQYFNSGISTQEKNSDKIRILQEVITIILPTDDNNENHSLSVTSMSVSHRKQSAKRISPNSCFTLCNLSKRLETTARESSFRHIFQGISVPRNNLPR